MAEQLLVDADIQWFAVGHDYVNKKVVLVTLHAAGTVWWQELAVPTTNYNNWSSPQEVTLPSGAEPNLVVGRKRVPTNVVHVARRHGRGNRARPESFVVKYLAWPLFELRNE